MAVDVRQLFLDKHIKDVVVSDDTHHLWVIIDWNEAFKKLGEHPERLFFAHYLQKSSHNKVKALAVTYFWIANGIGHTNSPELLNYLRIIKEVFAWICSLKVYINLMIIWVGKRSIIVFNDLPVGLAWMCAQHGI